MLFSPDGKRVDHLPDEREFKQQRSRLPRVAYDALLADANRLCDEADDLQCSDLLPRDWTQAPWPAVLAACRDDQSQAVQFIGHLLWTVLEKSPDKWTFHSSYADRFDLTEFHFVR